MRFHSLCEMFPVMSQLELRELADDIIAHGQREPILVYDGKIIDGRNRYLACQMAKREPEYAPFQGANPSALVKSLNIFRRHLNESQRAMLATELMGFGQICPNSREAAKAVNVSTGSVKSAIRVKKKAIKSVQKAVFDGSLKVSVADKIATLPKKEQRKVVRGGVEAMKKKAAAIDPPAEAPKEKEAEAPQADPSAEVLALVCFAEDYRRYWARRVSPHSSGVAPGLAEREMNDKIESLLAKHGAEAK